MGRKAVGTVAWRENPPPARWWARVTARDVQGKTVRRWVDLGRPELRNTPEDKKKAKKLAGLAARTALKVPFATKEQRLGLDPLLGSLEGRWFSLIDSAPTHGMDHNLKSVWRKHIAPRLGPLRLSQLTVPVLVEFVRDVATTKTARGGPPGPIHVRQVTGGLRMFLDAATASANEWARKAPNPMREPEVVNEIRKHAPLKHGKRGKVAYWQRDAFEALLAAPWADVWFGMVLISVLTGLRAGELHGLTFARLRIDDGEPIPYAQIQKQVVNAMDGNPVGIRLDKQGKPALKTLSSFRDMPLHPYAVTWLRWWWAHGWAMRVGRAPLPSDLVFPNRKGKPWRPVASPKLRLTLLRAALPDIFVLSGGREIPVTWHALRRTFATWLRRNKVDKDTRQALLGHDPKDVIDEFYAEPELQDKANAIATICITLPERAGVLSSEKAAQ